MSTNFRLEPIEPSERMVESKKNYISSRRLYKLQAKGVLEGGGNKKCANPDLLIEWTMSASNILARNIEPI